MEKALALLCSKCRKKHCLRECPVDNIVVCQICEDDHYTDHCPSLLEIKESYIADYEVVNALYAMESQKPWQSRPTCMSQQDSRFFYAQNQMWNILITWKL